MDTILLLKLRPKNVLEVMPDRSVTSPKEKTAESDLDLILQNNIFDADNRSDTLVMDLATDSQVVSQAELNTVLADLKLVGTVVSTEDSLALIQNSQELGIYHLGDEIPGGGIIETIERSQVSIRSGQRLVTLVLHEQQASSPGSRVAAPASAAQSRQASTGKELAGSIKEVGENRWMVSADMVESVRENFAAQMRLAQMEPRLVDGRTDGFLVRRINPRSILARMGLQRGDVVIDINNVRLDSPEKALQVVQQLREARRLSVAVERNGQPLNLVYEIE